MMHGQIPSCETLNFFPKMVQCRTLCEKENIAKAIPQEEMSVCLYIDKATSSRAIRAYI